MKRFLIFALLFTSIVFISSAQYVNHSQTYYTFDSAWAENVCLTKALSGDGYVIAPYGNKERSSGFFGLLKVDNDFNVDWKSFYNKSSSYFPYFYTKDLAIDTIKYGYVLCGTFDYFFTPSYISVFDANGSLLWMKKYPYIAEINSIIPIYYSPTISYVACGRNSEGKAVVFGLDSLGTTIWAKKVTSFDYSKYTDVIKVNSTGDIIVTGYQESDEVSSIVTRLTVSGNIVFSKEYRSSEKGLKLNAVCFDQGIYYYNPTLKLTGSLGDYSESDIVMMGITYYDGNLLTANYYDINENSTLEKGTDIMKLRNQNEIAITGESYITDFGITDTNGFILRLDTNGNYIAATIFGDTYENRLSKIVRNNANNGYTMGGHLIGDMDDQPYIVEAYNYVQEECYSHEKVVDPNAFTVDTTVVFHANDTVNGFQYNVYNYYNSIKKEVLCEKEKSNTERLGQNLTTEESLIVSPSVTSDFVYISNIDGAIEYEIYSSTGKLLLSSFSNSKSSIGLDMTNYSKGVYIIKILYNNDMITRKIIKM